MGPYSGLFFCTKCYYMSHLDFGVTHFILHLAMFRKNHEGQGIQEDRSYSSSWVFQYLSFQLFKSSCWYACYKTKFIECKKNYHKSNSNRYHLQDNKVPQQRARCHLVITKDLPFMRKEKRDWNEKMGPALAHTFLHFRSNTPASDIFFQLLIFFPP